MNSFVAVIFFISGCSMVNGVVEIAVTFSGPVTTHNRTAIFPENEYQLLTSEEENTSWYSILSSKLYERFDGFHFDDKLTLECTIRRIEKDEFGAPLNFELKSKVLKIYLPTKSGTDFQGELPESTGLFQQTVPDEYAHFQIQKLVPLVLIPADAQIFSVEPSIAISPIRLEQWEYNAYDSNTPGKCLYYIDRKTFASHAKVLPESSNYQYYEAKIEIDNQTFDLSEGKIKFVSEDEVPKESDPPSSSDNVTPGTPQRHFAVLELNEPPFETEQIYLGLHVQHLLDNEIVELKFPPLSYLVVDESDIKEGNVSYAIPWMSIETEYNYKFRPTGEVNYHNLLKSFASTGTAVREAIKGSKIHTKKLQNVTATPYCYMIESAKHSITGQLIAEFDVNSSRCAVYKFKQGDKLPEYAVRVVYIKATKA